MLKVVYSCNDGYFEPAYLTTLSILRRTQQPIAFYVLSADFSEFKPKFTLFSKEKEQIMKDLVKSFNSQNTFEVIDCRPIYNRMLGDLKWRKFWKKYWSPYIFLKLLMCELPQLTGKVFHVDVDTLFNKDIKEIFDIDMGGAEILASRDIFTRYKHLKRYFNVGALLCDMDKLRVSKSFNKTIEWIKRKRPLIAEQDGISYCCNIKKFPGNDFRFNWQWDGIKDDTVIKHFWSFIRLRPSHRYIRPWQIDKVQNILKLHNWDEDYKFFLQEQKKWKKD